MSKTMIKPCGCESKYQDQKYGEKMRVHNECKSPNSSALWRCTVCGTKRN